MFLWGPQQLVNYGHEVIQDFDWKRLLIERDTAGKIEENLDKVPEEIAKEITIYGTPDDCIEKIQRYFDAGVTGFAFIMELEDIRKTRDIYEITGNEIIPYFKEKT